MEKTNHDKNSKEVADSFKKKNHKILKDVILTGIPPFVFSVVVSCVILLT
jgi:hypothetical protein